MRNRAPFIRRPLSMTPLIDVIFLLLLFFMLSSTFSTFGEIELSSATTGASATDEPTDRIFVQLGAEDLSVNGTPLTLQDLDDEPLAGQILVSLADDTSSQRLVDFLARLRGREGLTVTVLE